MTPLPPTVALVATAIPPLLRGISVDLALLSFLGTRMLRAPTSECSWWTAPEVSCAPPVGLSSYSRTGRNIFAVESTIVLVCVCPPRACTRFFPQAFRAKAAPCLRWWFVTLTSFWPHALVRGRRDLPITMEYACLQRLRQLHLQHVPRCESYNSAAAVILFSIVYPTTRKFFA